MSDIAYNEQEAAAAQGGVPPAGATTGAPAEPVTLANQPPMPGAKWDDPAINYAERYQRALDEQKEEMIPVAVSTPGPLVPMSDEDALGLAREIEARYMVPPPPPSIRSQINAMKEGRGEPMAQAQADAQRAGMAHSAPPPQPNPLYPSGPVRGDAPTNPPTDPQPNTATIVSGTFQPQR